MPLLYAGYTQINAMVPQSLPDGAYPLIVFCGPTQSLPLTVTIRRLQPGIYTWNASGSGAGLLANALTGQLIVSNTPVRAGDILVAYGTGFGAVHGPAQESGPADGAAAPPGILFRTAATVTATVGGMNAPVLFAGLTPTLVGLYQVNFQVPAGVAPGSSIPLVITAKDPDTGAVAQSNTVTLPVQ